MRTAAIILLLGACCCVAPAADEPSTRPACVKMDVEWLTPRDLSATDKHPLAVLLADPKDEAEAAFFRGRLAGRLTEAGFHACIVRAEMAPRGTDKAPPPAESAIVELVRNSRFRGVIDTDRLLLVAGPSRAAQAIQWIHSSPDRVAGAVFLSAPPIVTAEGEVGLWKIDKPAAGVPVWVTVGDKPGDAAPLLVMWRQVAHAAEGASLSLDVRGGEGRGLLAPSEGLKNWLEAVTAGKKPKPVADVQIEGEKDRYAKLAAALKRAVAETGPATAGEEVAKREAPMRVSVTAPAGWGRFGQAERAYDGEASPYVQIYLTPRARGPLFARACAARWEKDAAGLLDDYAGRLREAGFLVIRHDRGQAGEYAVDITSILWPSEKRWHRWLVLSAAGKPTGKAAPLVFVMDASDRPDVRLMAGAMKRILGSISVRWVGGEPAKQPKLQIPREAHPKLPERVREHEEP